MGRVIWRSKSCGTCRRRKIKCDQEHPRCRNCRRACLRCEGYYETGALVHVPPSSSSSSPSRQNPKRQTPTVKRVTTEEMAMAVYVSPLTRVTVRRDDEMMALFINNFVPPESLPRCSKCETVSSWYENFPSQIGRSAVLDKALSALCHLYLGQRYGNQDWIRESKKLYASASEKLVSQKVRSVEELISASMVMATYELYDPFQGMYGWMIQVQCGTGLLEKRGPPTAENPLDRNLYRRVRPFSLYEACFRRKQTFLSRPEWRAAVQIGSDRYDELLDIAFQIPTILQLCDEAMWIARDPSPPLKDRAVLADLLDRFHRTNEQLLQWYRTLEQAETEPLYRMDSIPLTDRPLLRESPHLLPLFSGTLFFSSEQILELVMLYWFSGLVLYTSMGRLAQTLLQVQGLTMQMQMQEMSSPCPYVDAAILSFLSERDDIDGIARAFARLVCQAVAFCLQPTAGSQGFQLMLPTVWAAKEHFRLHNLPFNHSWCQDVLVAIAERGCGVGAVAAQTTYQQYVEMADRNWGIGRWW